MKELSAYILLALLFVPWTTAAGRAATRVYAKVDAETAIYPGDEFTYSIVVEGGGKPDKIDIAPLAAFKPRHAGSGTSMQTVNDRTTVSFSDNFVIAADKVGTMHLPGFHGANDQELCLDWLDIQFGRSTRASKLKSETQTERSPKLRWRQL